MRIAFVTNQLGLRGTEVALAAYASRARDDFGWTVYFLVRHPKNRRSGNPDFTPESYAHYERLFDVVYADSDRHAEEWLAANVDVALVEMSGNLFDWLPSSVPSVAHCVFEACYPLRCTVHTAISESVAAKGVPWVRALPYIADAPEPEGDMRAELGIPDGAVVFGRHGGFDTFDIDWVRRVVERVAADSPTTYFLFMNTQRFCDLPNVIHLPATTCPRRKAKFVATCDAMLHARDSGETFGLAVAEFALQHKPVITHAIARDTEHLRLLAHEGMTYRDAAECEAILRQFPKGRRTADTGYEAYRPHRVMPLFRSLVEEAVHKVVASESRFTVTLDKKLGARAGW